MNSKALPGSIIDHGESLLSAAFFHRPSPHRTFQKFSTADIYRRLIAQGPHPDTYVDLKARADPPSERPVAHDRNALATARHRRKGSGARHAVAVAVMGVSDAANQRPRGPVAVAKDCEVADGVESEGFGLDQGAV